MIHLILGGARSGKSRLAEQTAIQLNKPVTYVATAQAWDDEMRERIEHHQAQRPREWALVEEPVYLADRLKQIDQAGQLILVDCLTLWMSNLLMSDNAQLQIEECTKLLQILPQLKSEIILVSNETGLGVVPMGQISRKFVDESGRLHQQLGQIADKVLFCVAGFPMILKGDK
ncbi:bifunctional adenosylcobinamide kinase/adenosylcobinamide-phosphate guanylyltransferase [Acinetobacter sp. ANC 3813]|uniref:bifunctional adenosylcobinamide kinase/adenosylcobinamide-phosphate guanylyltransferase n=1 Tax=Acinetobacter sp. ANC 3813 TaxID=1977873 RepID=UPI000A357150|nr:bifunctional adenosylcobinamide kinase/adenosylcobinamide-phosphate guanylyltransferase [Acinetobacter sp. ANC 3813]OTG88866.1 bifunctional adenosylcobinamide kinase/adenosylcobinamide-phosphate guanylyltransferase [Acinetobacter sp. ANC 3813]